MQSEHPTTHVLLPPTPSWIPPIETSLSDLLYTDHDALTGLFALENSELAARHPHTTSQYASLGLWDRA